MKILLTGFEPFGGDSVNASQIAVEGCVAPEGVELRKLILPVVFQDAAEIVCREIDAVKPDAVICVGEAGGRSAVTPERVGINIMDARIPDNAGRQPVDVKIAPDGPDAYFSTLPIKSMVARMKAAGFDAAVSDTAGTFVCNNLMYAVLHCIAVRFGSAENTDALRRKGSAAPLAGFIHVPAERPVQNTDCTLKPIPATSASALSEALKVFI